MQMKFFSIVVVSLNSGTGLRDTLQSILMQTYTDYEVIVKDGGSTDGSLAFLETEGILDEYPQIQLIVEKDKSIYDGMNQAIPYVNGRYVQFLNCGDLFYDEQVLQSVAECIGEDNEIAIYYGNQYNRIQKTVVTSAPKINEFACYRNVPCHQVCFYDRRLFEKRAYITEYTVRADYEHFLYSVYEEKAKTHPMSVIVCTYEGGGYSETKENRKKSEAQHREITKKYMGIRAVLYRFIMILTFAGLRTALAESPRFSKAYNAIKSLIYRR